MEDVGRLLGVAAADLNERGIAPDLEVLVETRLWRGLFLTQGLLAYNLWTDVFEPVQRRWLLSRRWKAIQSPDDAAGKIEWFLNHRPDLMPDERRPG
jgi:hypothetical protein